MFSKILFFVFLDVVRKCECLGVTNSKGLGGKCEGESWVDYPYCYVDKNACTEEGIEWHAIQYPELDSFLIGYSYELCHRN